MASTAQCPPPSALVPASWCHGRVARVPVPGRQSLRAQAGLMMMIAAAAAIMPAAALVPKDEVLDLPGWEGPLPSRHF